MKSDDLYLLAEKYSELYDEQAGDGAPPSNIPDPKVQPQMALTMADEILTALADLINRSTIAQQALRKILQDNEKEESQGAADPVGDSINTGEGIASGPHPPLPGAGQDLGL